MAGVIAKFSGEYAWLSNFHESKVTMRTEGRDYVFPSGEHAFQSMKMHTMASKRREDFLQAVLDAPTPAKAKYVGRACTIDVAKWDEIKDQAMRDVVFAKFTEDDTLRAKLLATGASLLVEGNDWGDTYWGRVDGKGRNILGSILMEVRGYYHFVSKIGSPKMAQELQTKLVMSWS